MASDGHPAQWDELPDEILLQILGYLTPYDITRLQLVSRRLQKFCLDDDLWKQYCFDESPWYTSLKTRRKHKLILDARVKQLNAKHSVQDGNTEFDEEPVEPPPEDERQLRRRKLFDMANWDPAYPNETVSWYDEYIQRNGPASVNWLQMPRIRDREVEAIIEARGMALYNPYDGHDGAGNLLAVSPLDDGSVCLWDVNGNRGKRGGIIGRSSPGVLFIDGPHGHNTRRSKRIDTGVTECVSVDHRSHRAFFAVQGHLIEIDLNRLEVVSRESFEWSISTLSPIHDGAPLTVGTSLGIHLHDFRARASMQKDKPERVEWDGNDIFKSIFDPKPLPPYASLSQPTPISILHLPSSDSSSTVSNDIYVSGRFTNILHYDRRKFPAIVSSIYSGAFVNSLCSLLHPFNASDNENRRQAELNPEEMTAVKSATGGSTLIAGGTYKTKGSLEIYGLSETSDHSHRAAMHNAMRNRQTAASSSILSVINHGTKLVFADGAGFLKWFERDGFTESRRLKIGHADGNERSLFVSSSGPGELARKIVSTKSAASTDRMNNDNVLFWTGERLGMVSFTSSPLFGVKDFEEMADAESAEEQLQREDYSYQMREALNHQADELRLMERFGHSARQA